MSVDSIILQMIFVVIIVTLTFLHAFLRL